MANLSISQIKERIEKPLLRSEIEKAVRHEERIKLHTQTVIEERELGYGWRNFKEWVAQILPKDVYDKFIILARPPFPTLELTETIFDELSKVFQGKNKYVKYEFVNSDYESDALSYLDKIGDSKFWSGTAFETSKDAFNSYIVVDLPREQSTPLPEPYYYFLDAVNVWDIEFDIKGNVIWILIREDNNQFLYIDNIAYQRFTKVNDQFQVDEVLHRKGRCPVKDFMKTKRKRGNMVDAKSPLTNSIGELDWLLFFITSKKYLDLYGPFPVYWKYSEKCNYSSNEGDRCYDGVLSTGAECPVCSKRKHTIGVGTLIEVDPPIGKDQADLRNPVGVLPAEINSLNYCTGEIDRLTKSIFLNCVGQGGEPNNNQAQNEKQVQGAFESKINILTQFKENFEEAERWTKDTMFTFRYDKNFLRSIINYGDDFYLASVKDLSDDYKAAKEAGRPQFELERKREQIYATENKNNPDELNRIKILQELEPWPDLSISQCKSLGFDQLYPIEFTVKVNFTSFVRRFEREQASITLFGSLLSFDTKINLINAKLLEYGNEKVNTSRGNREPSEGIAA